MGFFVLAQDITERKRAEMAMRGSEEYIRAIMDNVVDSVVTIDEAGKVDSFNAAAQRTFGYAADEVVGRNVAMLMAEPDRSRHDTYIETYLETGKGKILGVGPREVTGRRKDGSTFDLELAVSAMVVGEKRMFIGVMRDVARRKATEVQLRQAQKMEAVGQLTGGVAHDFNNLLAGIMGNLELVDEGLAGEAGLRELVRNAIEAAERGADLTQRLLAFSRRQTLRPEVTDLNNLVGGMTTLLARTLGETVEIETVQAGGLWKTIVDPGQLENALLNLTLNARDAMPRGGKLTIETANAYLDQDYADAHDEVTPGQYVLLAVSDTGSGMPPDVMERIFEPFFTTKEEGRGSGLGLSMVFGFIKQSGGHIKFYSELGKGTTAKLYLPRTRQRPDQYRAPPPPTAAQLGRGEVVLVVEDDAIVRKMAMNLLESLGYRVLGAEDGPSALDLLERETAVDLLLTDVVLPGGMSGRDLAREALARRPEIKVLYTSGYSANAVVRNGIVDEGVQLVSKPYRKELLARMVRKSLDGDDR